jgi:hypothetical protein
MNVTIKLTWTEPYTPRPTLPPEGEPWVWRNKHGTTCVGHRFRGTVHWGDSTNGTIKYFTPLHPYIDPNSPVPLASVPEWEVCFTNMGERYRKADKVYDKHGTSWVGCDYEYVVCARPNAAKALQAQWPKTVGELEIGMMCQAGGRTIVERGMDRNATINIKLPTRQWYRANDSVPSNTPIDLDASDRPIIYGKGLVVEVTP